MQQFLLANFSVFWRSTLPIRGLKSCGMEVLSNFASHLEQLHLHELVCLDKAVLRQGGGGACISPFLVSWTIPQLGSGCQGNINTPNLWE